MTNWLDRLRSSRGFPTGDDHLDLDHFLAVPIPDSFDPSAESTQQGPSHLLPAARNERDYGDRGAVDVVGVLSELFCMGDQVSGIPRRKSSRKQANPKFCVLPPLENAIGCPSDDLRRENETGNHNALATSGRDNILTGRKENVGGDQLKVNVVPVSDPKYEEEEEEGEELKAYSRMDVTVIDTSVAEWKLERLLFRRKNVWKIREKKRKGKISGAKKRKAGALLCRVKGKARVLGSVSGLPNEGNGDAGEVPYLNEEQPPPPSERENKTGEGIMEAASEVPSKRLGSSNSPMKIERSSGILLKALPTISPPVERMKSGKSSLKRSERQISMIEEGSNSSHLQ
ncbi:hypothetical protein Dimus_000073 [Dionaea muscipula]